MLECKGGRGAEREAPEGVGGESGRERCAGADRREPDVSVEVIRFVVPSGEVIIFRVTTKNTESAKIRGECSLRALCSLRLTQFMVPGL